ncbi:uncharacterized protein LOC111360224 [Spodoptera litura]|uniref:Uncharacterized protein LOC111360224 n=1 Tax=Spodoptera litura TaxID=69820 RepID=A0A9J7EJ64_SPOLT|nr:uncharacterized protein LOC111360224 [Spodoptera litura]
MLADIEGKIDKERKHRRIEDIPTQFDLDENNDDIDYMNYGVTNIWWHDFHEPAPENSTELSTTSNLFKKASETTVHTHPPNWPFPEDFGTNITQQESLIQHDLKNSITVDGLGYGSASIDKLFDQIFKKEFRTANELFVTFVVDVNERISAGKLASMGQPLLRALTELLRNIANNRYGVHSNYATDIMEMVQTVIKNKNTFNGEYKELIDLYDSLFTKEEGEELLASLEVFEHYPEGGKTPEQVCERILNAFLAPYNKIEGTEEQKKIVRLLYKVSRKLTEIYALYNGYNSSIVPEGV